nr:MAG TPA: hypothetical protein [Caudoviricetes sp.]
MRGRYGKFYRRNLLIALNGGTQSRCRAAFFV